MVRGRHTSAREIRRVFTEHLQLKFDTIKVESHSIQALLEGVKVQIAPEANEMIQMPIMEEELRLAVMSGKKKKAPGYDGINNEFFQLAWEIIQEDLTNIVNNMLIDGTKEPSQTNGVTVYVPKKERPQLPEDYRPLTLLNTDTKLLARILVKQMRPWLNEILNPSQYCGVGDNNILGAVAAIRETVAETELTNEPVCLLSLDFKEAFDRMAHTYLYKVLEHYGFSNWLIERIRWMYDNALSTAQINGYISRAVLIKSSIRQGCPLSVSFFALCLDPLLRNITDAIERCRPNREKGRLAVVVYANDATIILRSCKKFQSYNRQYGNTKQ
jgi:hypothetical protein